MLVVERATRPGGLAGAFERQGYEFELSLHLMDAVGLLPNEQVQVYNVTNGQRFETYAIVGPRGSGTICVNGAAAHLAENGHKVIIANYGLFTEAEIAGYQPRVALVDERNRIAKLT